MESKTHLSPDANLMRFLKLPQLDPQIEEHAFLRRYKRARYERWRPAGNSMYELAVLQACLFSLGRLQEITELAIAMQPLVPREIIFAWEVFRTEVLSIGAYAAQSRGKYDEANQLLADWGTSAFGMFSRVGPNDLAKDYAIVGSADDELLQGIETLRDAHATGRLIDSCRRSIWLHTHLLVLRNRLAGVEKLDRAGVSESKILETIAICEPVLVHLLEVKRRESE